MKTKSLLLLLLGLGVFILQGCSDSEPKDSGINYADSTFTGLYNNLFSQECADCHKGSASADGYGQLDFTSQSAAHNTLTTLRPTGDSSDTCRGAFIVDTTTLADSYLLAVLFEDYYTQYSPCTPIRVHIEDQNINSLAANFKTALVQWISNGANND